MTIELDKAALSAAWQAFYSMDSADPSGMEAAIRAYLTSIQQPQRDAVVDAALDWQRSRTASQEKFRSWNRFKYALEILDATR